MPLSSIHIGDTCTSKDDDVKILLSPILQLNLQVESSEKIIVSTINQLLSLSKSRPQGLELLNLLIIRCSKAIILENGINWINYCLVKYQNDNLKEVKLYTIGKIVENVYTEQEFAKKFISDYMSKVLEICLSPHINTHEAEAAVDTLAICMRCYPSWFAPHKLKVETFLVNLLENSSEKLVEKAAVSFHYLQQVGGAGVDGVNHRLNFSTNFRKLCATIQNLLDKFFENETEIDQSERADLEGFSFVDIPCNSQKMLHVTSKRLKNCLIFLETMILKGFPVAKEIRPMNILDIIVRGTALHHCVSTEKEKSMEDFQFSLLLNRLQIQLLQLLRASIVWFQANYLPFSYIISKILVDCLNKSQKCACFKTDSLYQEMVYRVLSDWLRISKDSIHTHFQTQLMFCILNDITPAKNHVTLSLKNDTSKNKSAKAKRKAIQERIVSSGHSTNKTLSSAEKFNQETNCLFALDTLKCLFTATTLKLKENVLQELYTSILNTVVDMQTLKIAHPYTNSNCQAKLYEVLVAFYEQEILKVLPSIHFTIDILNRGINDKNQNISTVCEHGLRILERLCQPICPSLYTLEITRKKDIEEQLDLNNEEAFSGSMEGNKQNTAKNIFEHTTDEIACCHVTTEHHDEGSAQNLQSSSVTILEDRIVKEAATDQLQENSKPLMTNYKPTEDVIASPDGVIPKIETLSKSFEEQIQHEINILKTEICSNETGKTVSENKGNIIKKEIILKSENLSNTSIHFCDVTKGSSNETVEETFLESEEQQKPESNKETMISLKNLENDEPPSKKTKTVDEPNIVEVQDGTKPIEDADAIFVEDDAFVDEIREY